MKPVTCKSLDLVSSTNHYIFELAYDDETSPCRRAVAWPFSQQLAHERSMLKWLIDALVSIVGAPYTYLLLNQEFRTHGISCWKMTAEQSDNSRARRNRRPLVNLAGGRVWVVGVPHKKALRFDQDTGRELTHSAR